MKIVKFKNNIQYINIVEYYNNIYFYKLKLGYD